MKKLKQWQDVYERSLGLQWFRICEKQKQIGMTVLNCIWIPIQAILIIHYGWNFSLIPLLMFTLMSIME
jgi:hypothetical protein